MKRLLARIREWWHWRFHDDRGGPFCAEHWCYRCGRSYPNRVVRKQRC